MLGYVVALCLVIGCTGVPSILVARRRAHRRCLDPRLRARVGVCCLLGLLAAGLYDDWIMETAVDGPAAPVHGYVSELGARTQPHSGVFNALAVMSGSLLLLLALALVQLLGERGRVRIAAAAIAVLAVGTVCDGLLPMDCAPSRSRSCLHSEQRWHVSWVDLVHTGESVLSTIAVLTAMTSLAVDLWSVPLWRRLARISAGLLMPLTALEVYQALRVLTGHLVATSERGSTTLIALWLAALAATVLRRLTIPVPLPVEQHGAARRAAGRRGEPAAGAVPGAGRSVPPLRRTPGR